MKHTVTLTQDERQTRVGVRGCNHYGGRLRVLASQSREAGNSVLVKTEAKPFTRSLER